MCVGDGTMARRCGVARRGHGSPFSSCWTTAPALVVQTAAGEAGGRSLGMHDVFPVPRAHGTLTPGAIRHPLHRADRRLLCCVLGSRSLVSRPGRPVSSAQEQLGLAGLWAAPCLQPLPSLCGWTLPQPG